MSTHSFRTFSAVLLLVSAAVAQGDVRIAAIFDGGAVTWDEFYEELARRHRGKSLGKESLDHLIEKQIVEAEAKRRGEVISKQEIDRYLETLEKQLASQQRSLREHLRSRATSLESFREYLALSRLYERLARKDLGIEPGAPLDGGRLKLWISEQKRKHAVVIDVSKLPQGAAAIVDGEQVPLRELGRVMARNLVADERHSMLRQMIAYRLLQIQASKLEIEIDAADYDRALAAKRADIAANPEYKKHGIDLERLLQAQGRSVDDLTRGEVFRAEVLIDALGRARYSDDSLERAAAADPALWERRVGATRELHRILLAVGGPAESPELSRDEKKAFEDAKLLRAKIKAPNQFAAAARQFSDDQGSKGRGGRLGWFHREEPGVEDALLKAAFALEVGTISEPVRDGQGVSLLMVTAVRKGPEGARRLEAMRRYEMAGWLRDLVAAAKVEFRPIPAH